VREIKRARMHRPAARECKSKEKLRKEGKKGAGEVDGV
jgi:hypothetical protein